jgi:hypothetical protein
MRSFAIILISLFGLGPLLAWAFDAPKFEKYFGAPMHKLFGYDVLHSNQYIHSSMDFVTGLVWFFFVMFVANYVISILNALFGPREEASKEEVKALSLEEQKAADAYMRAEVAQLRRSRFRKPKAKPSKA